MSFRISHITLLLALGLLGLLAQSCSLLKFEIESDAKPLTETQLNQRLSVRLYCTNFTEGIITTADTIFALSSDPIVKLNSIIWKANTTTACMTTALHSIPESALLNTWVFVSGMNDFVAADTTFAEHQHIAEIASGKLLTNYTRVARTYLKQDKYAQMSSFVDSVVVANPYTFDFITKDYTSDWLRYAGIADSTYISTYGSISETIGDISDKSSFYAGDISNQIDWTIDRANLKISQGLLDSTQMARLENLENTITALKDFMANAPEIVDGFSKDMESQLIMTMSSLQQVVNTTMLSLSNERVMVEQYVSLEREAIIDQTQKAVDSSIQKVLDALPDMIRATFTYVIIGIIILLGIPFIIGFYLGKFRTRSKNK